jgi:hypothetical protein
MNLTTIRNQWSTIANKEFDKIVDMRSENSDFSINVRYIDSKGLQIVLIQKVLEKLWKNDRMRCLLSAKFILNLFTP